MEIQIFFNCIHFNNLNFMITTWGNCIFYLLTLFSTLELDFLGVGGGGVAVGIIQTIELVIAVIYPRNLLPLLLRVRGHQLAWLRSTTAKICNKIFALHFNLLLLFAEFFVVLLLIRTWLLSVRNHLHQTSKCL